MITVLLLTLFMRFSIANTIVASGSMEPTLMTGDIVIYNRLAYVLRDIRRGDIILFHSDEYNADMGKRVIGIAGSLSRLFRLFLCSHLTANVSDADVIYQLAVDSLFFI